MTEAFLFHAWQHRLFKTQELITGEGEPVRVIHPGLLNSDAGPDFINARIRIGETLWAGNVEIHLRASDWKKHRHQHDPAYANIILHVVYEADEAIERPDGSLIPVLVLEEEIQEQALKNYHYLLSNRQWIPCVTRIGQVDKMVIDMQISRMLTERLERKTLEILHELKNNHYNWEETFYRSLAKNFGFHTNAVPFELVAKALPESLLARHKSSQLQVEAMIFGVAGLLVPDYADEYPRQLKSEFHFLKNKFNVHPIQAHLWKFLRLRPANFPTIRLAQFSSLIVKSNRLFVHMLEASDIDGVRKMLSVDVSPYWKTHFTFDHPSRYTDKVIGQLSISNILINTIVPFLFIYGTQKGLLVYRERALSFLERIPAEKNHILDQWNELGISAKSAADSQGLIELKNNYCQAKKCLQCSIGNKVLRNESIPALEI